MWRTLIQEMTSLFCTHEWARRRDAGHVYLECVHCLAITPGIEFGPATSLPANQAHRQALKVAEA
jgi:hypothetical protein